MTIEEAWAALEKVATDLSAKEQRATEEWGRNLALAVLEETWTIARTDARWEALRARIAALGKEAESEL